MSEKERLDKISEAIIGAAIEVHLLKNGIVRLVHQLDDSV